VLPSRKQRSAAQVASRACEAKASSLKKEKLIGPMTPEGTWLSKGRKFLSETQCAPAASRWRHNKDLKGNWEPVYLPLMVLNTRLRRNLCKNPGRVFKGKLPTGAQRVYPDRDSVMAFQRRAYALLYVREAFSLMPVLKPEDCVAALETSLSLLPEIFSVSSNFSKEYFHLRRQFHVFLRQKNCEIKTGLAAQEGSSKRAPH